MTTDVGTGRVALPAGRRIAKPSRQSIKRAALGLALLAGTAAAAEFGYTYWTVGRFLESTDDAYVQADYTTIAPKVSGYIAAVLVEDNQPVKAGDVLARIDDRDLRTALDQAAADVATGAAEIGNIDAQLQLQHSLIEEARAAILADQAAVTFATEDAQRQHDLMQREVASVRVAQQSQTALRQQAAALQRDQAALAAAQQQIEVLKTARAKAEAQLQHFQAIEAQARLNLGYATITAPVDGTVGARSLRVGQYVQAGTALMAVVPLNAVYVVGNFKETQLTDVRPGQPAEIRIDTFPGARLKGHVDSLAPASGLTFALLPPDNATGNFTKIVQRIPVKIALDDGALAGLLRPGMSVEPTIDTQAQAAALPTATPRVAAR
jgi:membrane fusion protein (multidrug efflux system)